MTLGAGGYGRYDDDPEWVGCPRAKSRADPCIARDGRIGLAAADRSCMGCGEAPRPLLAESAALPKRTGPLTPRPPAETGDRLRDLVRDTTEPADTLEAP